MPTHWTYSEFDRESDLCQGDILRRTPELLSILEIVHSHFCDEKYTSFLVLTQTCDLVRRGGGDCSARHVTLCVIRELDLVLPYMLSDICGTEIPGVYTKEGRIYAEQLLVRIVNQNEQARGLFYLHPDADVGIATPSVAFLRISIALRREHYTILRQARSGRIVPEFSAKLGWLTGNLYSRVPTPDWDEKNGKHSAKNLAKSLLASSSEAGEQSWVSERWLNAARSANVDFTQLDRTNAFSALQHHAPLEPIEVIADRLDKLSRELVLTEQAPRIRDELRDDDQFVNMVCDAVSVVAGAVIGEEKSVKLGTRLRADVAFRESIANHVQVSVKRAARDHEHEPGEAVCSLLAVQTGMSASSLQVLEQAIAEPEITDVQIAELQAKIKDSHLYGNAAIDHVREIVNATMADGSLERIRKVISRIRNDQQVKNALRAQQMPLVAE